MHRLRVSWNTMAPMISRCPSSSVPTEASEMFHSPEMPEQPLFVGFWVDDIVTKDKPTRYGKNNHFTYAEQPTVIVQGSQRKINIYCAISAA